MSIQLKGLKRNTIDKFYTNSSSVLACIAILNQHINIDYGNDLIIEPSAGNGAFIPPLKLLSMHHQFYDIEPEHPEIIRQDFLVLPLPPTIHKIHVIGNPPFGRQSSMAIQFIKKSCEFADTVAFILPKSFKKDSLRKTFPPHFHLMSETDMPTNSFSVNGSDYDVPCVFQIWVKLADIRPSKSKIFAENFEFTSKTDHPDISFRRVGVNAGIVDIATSENGFLNSKSAQSHYFIRFTNRENVAETIKKIQNIQFISDNTVGPKSISKPELIAEFNARIGNIRSNIINNVIV